MRVGAGLQFSGIWFCRLLKEDVAMQEQQEQRDPRTIKSLLNELAEETTDLVRQEAALARAETNEKLHLATRAIVFLVIGGAIAIAGLFYVLDAVVYGLARFMPGEYRLWLAALIVGLVVLTIGFFMLRKAQKDLKPNRLTPKRSAESIQRDVQLARGQMK